VALLHAIRATSHRLKCCGAHEEVHTLYFKKVLLMQLLIKVFEKCNN